MRILYISNANKMAGAGIALLNMIKGVREAGHEVLVAVTSDNGEFPDVLQDLGFSLVRCSFRMSIYPIRGKWWEYIPRVFKMVLDNDRGRAQLRKIILEFKPDIVHTNVGPLDAAFDVCQQLGVKHVWHLREYQVDMCFFPARTCFLKKIRSRGNYNICITPGVMRYFGLKGCAESRVIFDGVLSEKDVPVQLPVIKEKYVLFVGRIEPQKGPLDLLRVFAKFHQFCPDYHLRLVGLFRSESPYYKECLSLVSKEGLEDVVEFLGEQKDVYQQMQHATMLVVPSHFEGFGFITVEAMANGCPVIGRDTAGTKEQFDIGLEMSGAEIGLRFTNDEDCLRAMLYVVNHPVDEMCQRARVTILQCYTVERMLKELLAFYKMIMSVKQ